MDSATFDLSQDIRNTVLQDMLDLQAIGLATQKEVDEARAIATRQSGSFRTHATLMDMEPAFA